MKRVYIYSIDFVLPLPMTALMFVLWQRRTGREVFALYVLTPGVLFGHIFPGIGTNILRLWRFNGPLRIGNCFLHHGFIYAPYLSLTFSIAFAAGAPLTAGNIARGFDGERPDVFDRTVEFVNRHHLDVAQPSAMTVDQLQEGLYYAWKETYRFGSILKRVAGAATRPILDLGADLKFRSYQRTFLPAEMGVEP